jgi:RNA polymerase sigma-70 factor (ECF subfamily)
MGYPSYRADGLAGTVRQRMARSDEELVAAGQGGDAPAIDELLRRHYDRIYAVCRRVAGNEADALDATQDALMAIVRGLPKFDGRSKFTTWSYRVATNACLDELRRRRRRPDPIDNEALDRSLHAREQQTVGSASSLEEGVVNGLDIDTALQQLPEHYRAPVVLRDMADLDYAEIAAVLDLPPGTVRSRIARGRAALAKILAHADESEFSGNQIDGDERLRALDD